MHVGNFHFAGERGIVIGALPGARWAFVWGIEAAGRAVKPIIVVLDRMGGVVPLGGVVIIVIPIVVAASPSSSTTSAIGSSAVIGVLLDSSGLLVTDRRRWRRWHLYIVGVCRWRWRGHGLVGGCARVRWDLVGVHRWWHGRCWHVVCG